MVSLFKQTPSLEQANVCSGESFFSSASECSVNHLFDSAQCDYFESNPGRSLGLGSRYRDNVVPQLILGVGW